ncbi:MAG: hypothetical protein DHS20C20_02060 [Ardenticatenaceae bacterium]|nr:MAG: hypothetical protein DHS20C20_02060 [Ardenticatenaceae bacterium]
MSTHRKIPTTTEEITAVWLTKALRRSGVIGEETAVGANSHSSCFLSFFHMEEVFMV